MTYEPTTGQQPANEKTAREPETKEKQTAKRQADEADKNGSVDHAI